MKKTPRGFKIYSEFKDSHQNTIRVQESSSACIRACWIFVKNRQGEEVDLNRVTGESTSATAHLTQAQAKRLAKALLKFVEDV